MVYNNNCLLYEWNVNYSVVPYLIREAIQTCASLALFRNTHTSHSKLCINEANEQ